MPGHTYHSFPHPVELHPNVSRSDGGARQDHVLDLGGQAEEAVGVVGGVDLVSEAEVGQVVHVDPIPKGHGDGVMSFRSRTRSTACLKDSSPISRAM